MPPFLGMLASPTVLLNAALSFLPDRSIAVRGPDSVAVVSPKFNEESSAAVALTSLLGQTEPLDEVVISINGGSDGTAAEVHRTLSEHGFVGGNREQLPAFTAAVQRWHAATATTRVIVIEHYEPISKAESVNVAVLSKLATARRILVVDGDTVLASTFVAGIKNHFYRFRTLDGRAAGGGGRDKRFILEDFAMQSGAVRSQRPSGAGAIAWWVWLARTGEYAVSAVLRSGQTKRVGATGPLARSRLFTVVGCGFVARSDTFPMPGDTRTEDHDFTLAVQNRDATTSQTSARALDQRGFRLVIGGRETTFSDHLGYDTEVELRTGACARFVDEAVMYTEDPQHSPGLLGQLERWNGGAIENAHKRLAAPRGAARMRPNVRFAVTSALVENAVGLSLVLVLPAVLGLRFGFEWSQSLATGVGAWLAFDMAGCAALTLLGLRRAWRNGALPPAAVGAATSGGGRRAPWQSLVLRAVVVAGPLQLLRIVNAISYVAAASRTLPGLLQGRKPYQSPQAAALASAVVAEVRRPSITWERPAAIVPRAAYARTAGTTLMMALVVMAVFSSTALVASSTTRPDRSAWRLIFEAPRLDMSAHVALPVATVISDTARARQPRQLVVATRPVNSSNRARGPASHVAGLSPYCSPALVAGPGSEQRLIQGAGAGDYRPLSAWGILVLARLAPLLAHLEEAAGAYGIDADLLLRVILNESYLDPLAVGPTEDLGLAQVTSDSLTLLRSVSLDENSPLYNPALLTNGFSVFDPAFSLCAGAAKLAWASSQPFGESEEVAYARYINPLVGVVKGGVAETHVAAVAAMTALTPLTRLLGSTIAAYRADPASVTDEERRLLDVSAAVKSGSIGLSQAYSQTAVLVEEMKVLDAELYDRVLDRIYGEAPDPAADLGTILATVPEMTATNSSSAGP
ncbi:MAG TPA: transglycosylase SLT domain-containing protein [Trueperaceae bacterium]|nr:transglycosylase SLT domain-containing protein [Trueperaceae bacterium]